MPVPSRDAFRDDLEITIARDTVIGVSPAKTDISDAKTSDVTKVSQVRNVGLIMHEQASIAPSVSASQRLDTRSDHLS